MKSFGYFQLNIYFNFSLTLQFPRLESQSRHSVSSSMLKVRTRWNIKYALWVTYSLYVNYMHLCIDLFPEYRYTIQGKSGNMYPIPRVLYSSENQVLRRFKLLLQVENHNHPISFWLVETFTANFIARIALAKLLVLISICDFDMLGNWIESFPFKFLLVF